MKQKTQQNAMKLEVIRQSRPRPEVRYRPVIFENRTKYNRKREKDAARKSGWPEQVSPASLYR